MTNHTTQTSTRLLRPPAPGGQGIPGWWLPVAVVLAGSDAASSLLDPTLPYLLAGGLAAVVATGTPAARAAAAAAEAAGVAAAGAAASGWAPPPRPPPRARPPASPAVHPLARSPSQAWPAARWCSLG
jgi:hypothetical protein